MFYKYYRFNNEQEVPQTWPPGVSVSVVGRIIDTPPVYNESGIVTEPLTYKPGWHVNICYTGNVNLSHLNQYEIQVNSPRRVWFGQTNK
jgi:hypothetical protein